MGCQEFDKYKEILKTKPIYDVIVDDTKSEIRINIGNPELCINRRHTGDHKFNKYRKYVKNQECFITSFKNEIGVSISGYWDLQYNSKSIISCKTEEDNIQEIFNVIFQGHNISDIRTNKDKIKIYFSNKMVLNIYNENNEENEIYLVPDLKIYFGWHDNEYIAFYYNNEGLIKRINYRVNYGK